MLRKKKTVSESNPEAARAACQRYWAGRASLEDTVQAIREANLAPLQFQWIKNWVPRSGGDTGQRCDALRGLLDQLAGE